jgi:phage recombination protein Bet
VTGKELEPTQGALALDPGQTHWTPEQDAALAQIGIVDASDPDKQVFLHVCQRKGLDPFARQIHMIGRMERQQAPDGEWVRVKKWTIQTGIDGFRLIADRADRRDHTRRTYGDMLWYDREGNPRPVWTARTPPAAAVCIIVRDGQQYPGVASYDEYVQTKANGDPNSMWARMPSNQLMKCAEALALRRAYPEDLSGIYTDDEMGQADNPTPPTVVQVPNGDDDLEAIRRQANGGDTPEDAAEGEPMIDPDQHKEIGERLLAMGADRKGALAYVNDCLPDDRSVKSRNDLTHAEAELVLVSLRKDAEPLPDTNPPSDQPLPDPSDGNDPWADGSAQAPPK